MHNTSHMIPYYHEVSAQGQHMNANIEKTQSYWRSSDQQWNVNFVSQLQCWLPERFYMMKVLVFPEQHCSQSSHSGTSKLETGGPAAAVLYRESRGLELSGEEHQYTLNSQFVLEKMLVLASKILPEIYFCQKSSDQC